MADIVGARKRSDVRVRQQEASSSAIAPLKGRQDSRPLRFRPKGFSRLGAPPKGQRAAQRRYSTFSGATLHPDLLGEPPLYWQAGGIAGSPTQHPRRNVEA